MGEIVRRALAYPYATPGHSFVLAAGRVLELPEAGPDLRGRTALLAYGSNAAPEALIRKLAAIPDVPLPVLRAELSDFDVVYSAHVSPYGSVPATLRRSPGTTAAVHVVYPDSEQLPLLAATEPNYELSRLWSISCRVDAGLTLTELDAFVSRHGCLSVASAALALAEIEASGRRLAATSQPRLLEHVRSQLAPRLSLKDFIAACIETGGLAPLPELTPL